MPRSSKQQLSLLDGTEMSQVDARLQRLMDICGIATLPPKRVMSVPMEQIIIPDEKLVRPSKKFIENIELVNIQEPLILAFCSGSAIDAPDAQYEVVMGRRRAKAGRILLTKKQDARFKILQCVVYEQYVPKLNDFLALVENSLRSEAWIQEVQRLRRLVEDKVPMTLDDLAQFGFNRRTVGKRLQIALLPRPIVDEVCTGAVSLDVAMQITRLNEGQRAYLAKLLEEGEALTEDLVKTILKRQMNQGFSVVQAQIAQLWTDLPTPPAEPSLEASDTASGSSVSPETVLTVLKQFEPQTHEVRWQALGALTRALIQRLETTLREENPSIP
jgi:hypothetical protein